MKFAPLHLISGYSFLQSGLTIEKIAQSVKNFDYFGAGLADYDVMYGVPSFYNAIQKINKKPLIGITIKLDDNYLSLYAKNEDGYLSLSELSSSIQKGKMDLSLIKKEGLIGILDTHNSKIYENFKENKFDEAFARLIAKYSSFAKDFYLGVEISSKEDRAIANNIRTWGKDHTYSLVAFPRIRYVKEEDAIVIKIVEAIQNEQILDIKEEKGNERFFLEESYLSLYTKEEVDNTVNIINLSTFDYHKKRGELLHYQENIDSSELLRKMSYDSLKKLNLDKNETYINQLEHELKVICSMGYANYFLVVQDYVSFAKNNDILVGPGRGSAAGSLVSYLLNITEIDPIKYGLSFERFLNSERKTMPDIDIDFMDTRRDEVVSYCRKKYGEDRVSNIITYQTIQAKQALRDIGRIYDIPTRHIDKLSKNILGDYSLREAYKNLPNFKEIIDSDKYFLEIVSLASKIEGLPRQAGVHAAGIILNNEPIHKAMPTSLDSINNTISQYEMNYLEEQGFLKMDFLGLKNLTIISRCVDLINKNHKDTNLSKKDIPFDDPKVYELISSCRTMGIFQLESSGMKRAIREIKPNCFEDVVAVLALFRPGPMKSISVYAKRKMGLEKPTYICPSLEKILSSTYGIIVYQEQISSIVTTMAGFSLGEADIFRRAISKKKEDVLASLEKSFIDGAMKNGHTYKQSKTVFDLILRFADYGFNRSHSVGYATIACQMAYLKAYYPLEFYSAILENSSTSDDTKFNEYVTEMKSLNIKMLPPDINKSTLNFSTNENGIIYPLSAIKGINELTAIKILDERENGIFTDLFDFTKRMHAYKISDNQMSRLIDSGAFDCFSKSRATLRANMASANMYADICYASNGALVLIEPEKPLLREENDDPLENLDKEYEALGIMLSNNPLHFKKDLLVAKNVTPILDAINGNEIFKVAGIVKSKKTITTKKGQTMAFIKIFDETGDLEIIVFPDLYLKHVLTLVKNNIVVIEGKIETKKDETNFIANEISLLEE